MSRTSYSRYTLNECYLNTRNLRNRMSEPMLVVVEDNSWSVDLTSINLSKVFGEVSHPGSVQQISSIGIADAVQ